MAPRIVSLALACALVAAPAAAQGTDTPVYQSPTGLWLQPDKARTVLYGPTSPDANWTIEQWDIPQDLPHFNAAGVAQNEYERVAWLGGGRYELSQDGTNLACQKHFPTGRTMVNEVDLFATPVNGNEPRFPQATLDIREALAGLAAVDAAITLKIKQASAVDADCSDTHGGFVFAVVLFNAARKQVLFYQLRLAHFVSTGGIMAPAEPPPVWFATGTNPQFGGTGQFGYGDNITQYGQPWARIGTTQSYRVNLLPRLRSLIRDGERFGLDQNLADWQVTGTYHGQGVNGHMRNDAVWSGFALSTRRQE